VIYLFAQAVNQNSAAHNHNGAKKQ
jgi:hypothetical protein